MTDVLQGENYTFHSCVYFNLSALTTLEANDRSVECVFLDH